MKYKYLGFSQRLIKCKNNLFNSDIYFKKALDEVEGFEKNIFLRKLRNIWNEYTKNVSKSGYLDQFNYTIKTILKKKDKISILDLGGGYGDNFYKFRRFNQSKLSKIEYYILEENKRLIDLGKKTFKEEKSIFFKNTIPKKPVSIILMVGTLQYVNNFFELLKKINFEKISYIYFSRSIFSNLDKDYFSKQKLLNNNNVEQQIKIYSLESFTKKMKKNNFKIIFIRKNQLLNHFFKDLRSEKNIYYFDILFSRNNS